MFHFIITKFTTCSGAVLALEGVTILPATEKNQLLWRPFKWPLKHWVGQEWDSGAQAIHNTVVLSIELQRNRGGTVKSQQNSRGTGIAKVDVAAYFIEAPLYIEVQETTPNFCPKNLGISVSGMGQLQGVFGA